MAGFDFPFSVARPSAPLGRGLLHQMGRIASPYGLTVSIESRRSTRWRTAFYARIDGPLDALQAAERDIAVALMAYAEGYERPRSRRARASVAQTVLSAFSYRLEHMTNEVGRIAGMVNGVPNSSVFDFRGAKSINKRIGAYTDSLNAYYAGQLPGDVVLEETHTVLLWLLNLVSDRPGSDFPTLLKQATKAGVLDRAEGAQLRQLNASRNAAKHRNEAAGDDAHTHISNGRGAIHKLLAALNRGAENRLNQADLAKDDFAR